MSEEQSHQLTLTGKKKFIPKLYVNLGRCRYPVIRDVVESMGMCVDFDDEDLASTMTKTIEQPQRNSSASTTNVNQQRSNLSLLANGNNLARQPLFHDAVYKMIESRRSHIMWSDVTVTPQQLSSCAVWQRLNHFPGISQTLSRKVPLGKTMMRAWKLAPEHFGELVPLSFSLKKDTPVLRQYFEEIEFSKKLKKRTKKQLQQQQNSVASSETAAASTVATISPTNPFKDTKVFIFKPNAGCMGHDIKLTCKPLQMMQKLLTGVNIKLSKHLKEDEDFVCQAYIDRPMLIDKRKFDLRVYVLLMGVTPDLRILVHEEGLVRICATEYVEPKASNVRKSTMHLTNFAVNKKTLGKQQQEQEKATTSSDDDDEDNEIGEVVGDDDDDDQQRQRQQATQDSATKIDGIKRDFKFFNSMLDREYSHLGGSAELWRRIDRAMVMSLIAAHPELDRIYRQASASNQVLLKRTANVFLKDLKAESEKEKEKEEQRKEEHKETANEDQQEDDEDGDDGEDDNENENDEETDDQEEQQQNHQKSAPNTNNSKFSATAFLEKITSEEDFITNCCIGRNCFELLGFDLLLTESGHPYIMEVNHGPSLETGAEIDLRIKSKVLEDTFQHVSTFLPDSTKKKHLRARRYLQRICRRGGLNPMLDLEKSGKNANTGYRIAYPLVEPFKNEQDRQLSEEYQRAKAIIWGAEQQQSTNTTNTPSSASISTPTTTPTTLKKLGASSKLNKSSSSATTNSGTNSRSNSSRPKFPMNNSGGNGINRRTPSTSVSATTATNLVETRRRSSVTSGSSATTSPATSTPTVLPVATKRKASSMTAKRSVDDDPRASRTMKM